MGLRGAGRLDRLYPRPVLANGDLDERFCGLVKVPLVEVQGCDAPRWRHTTLWGKSSGGLNETKDETVLLARL